MVVWLETLEKMNFIQNTGKQGTSSTICAKNIPRIAGKKTNKNYDKDTSSALFLVIFKK